MSNIIRTFQREMKKKQDRNWDEIYVAVDIHDTIFKASYYTPEMFEWIGKSKECLKLMSDCEFIKLILWSSTRKEDLDDYLNVFSENEIVFDCVNCNPFVKNTDLSDFDSKFYMNVILDDKAGFEPEIDWDLIFDFLKNNIIE